jgi:hypothetical protein
LRQLVEFGGHKAPNWKGRLSVAHSGTTQTSAAWEAAASKQALPSRSQLQFGNASTLETPFLSLPFGRQECLPYNGNFAAFPNSDSMVLEILHRFLVFLRRRSRLKGAEVSPLACLWIFLPRI